MKKIELEYTIEDFEVSIKPVYNTEDPSKSHKFLGEIRSSHHLFRLGNPLGPEELMYGSTMYDYYMSDRRDPSVALVLPIWLIYDPLPRLRLHLSDEVESGDNLVGLIIISEMDVHLGRCPSSTRNDAKEFKKWAIAECEKCVEIYENWFNGEVYKYKIKHLGEMVYESKKLVYGYKNCRDQIAKRIENLDREVVDLTLKLSTLASEKDAVKGILDELHLNTTDYIRKCSNKCIVNYFKGSCELLINIKYSYTELFKNCDILVDTVEILRLAYLASRNKGEVTLSMRGNIK